MDLTDLERDFARVGELCFELESAPANPRVVRRMAAAFTRAVEKAFVVGWLKNDQVDPTQSNPSVLRAAERGARDYLP